MSGQIIKVILQAETVLNSFLAFNVSTFQIFSLQSKRLTDVYICQLTFMILLSSLISYSHSLVQSEEVKRLSLKIICTKT